MGIFVCPTARVKSNGRSRVTADISNRPRYRDGGSGLEGKLPACWGGVYREPPPSAKANSALTGRNFARYTDDSGPDARRMPMTLPASESPIPRLIPDAPLPPYAYVSGRFPHPNRDIAGHSYGEAIPSIPPVEPQRWSECRSYLLGIDLFNHGYYWEAHEEWEAVWNAHQRRGPVADFVKGLIILACAGVKAREGRPEGVRRLSQRAAELFGQTRDTGFVTNGIAMGLSLDQLVDNARRLVAAPEQVINVSDTSVEIVMPFSLTPQTS